MLLTLLLLSQLPKPEQLTLANELKKDIDALVLRGKQLRARLEGAKQAVGKTLSRDEAAALDSEAKAMKQDAEKLDADCSAYDAKVRQLGLDRPLDMLESGCHDYFSSTHEQGDCTPWRKLKVAFWTEKEPCRGPAADTLAWVQQTYARWHEDREQAMKKDDARAAEAAVMLQPFSGNPRQRAIRAPGALDARALFAKTHPSHFVFLRKDVAEAPPSGKDELPITFTRKLKKGEAVLPLRMLAPSAGWVKIVSIDGNRGMVKMEDLALAPLPGTKVAPLTAADLDAGGAGPAWLAPDATGFNLDEPNAWLEQLDPPEPRAQTFLETKQKVLGCYRKQIGRLDPDGTISKYYDVVTYGRHGIERIEPAAVNFDRKACAACACKAFNETKRKLIKEAIAPAQKQAFEAYAAIVEQLTKTDFAAASKDAPKGDESWVSRAE